ncbi:hypothetical protein [Nocardioides sp. YIM 152315]|uniref:hypothetical protein n=1 Tax=Nocardioides sp. YIM 152315 TaxID=3031760 RepID=UPI0023DB4177|nr:hypothetical protein [Nocardioides sp. YIM 152315]MDF1603315.1 hypothetical protein [Nocardioides sp. YIM 152315]
MTEHDLSTMLRDHLADEPPLRQSGADVIRTARRESRRRRALEAGAGVLAVAALAATGLGVGEQLRGEDSSTPVAQEATPPLARTMERSASAAFTPYVGPLGDPTWTVKSLLGDTVDPGDPAAQHYLLSYRPSGGPSVQVNLTVGGYAPADFDTYDFASSCDHQLAQGLAATCEMSALDDGSLLMTTVAPRARIGSDAPRMLTLDEAASRPPGSVLWVRVVGLSTRDGIAVDASEYVRAADADSADWQVPLDVLEGLALDQTLRDADLAHEPMPAVTGE